MTVADNTARWYRYGDMTSQAEALFRFIKQTIDTELVEELAFLANYDETRRAIQEIVDLPDRQIDLYIRFCLQNNGRLSARKQANQSVYSSKMKNVIDAYKMVISDQEADYAPALTIDSHEPHAVLSLIPS
jgi:hypothetical protein